MPALLCLNDLSCDADEPVERAADAVTELVDTLLAARRIRRDTHLLSAVQLGAVEFVRGYTLVHWQKAGRDHRDKWRLLRAMQNKAPFNPAEAGLDESMQFLFGQQAALGLGMAYLVDGVAVSLPLADAWKCSRLAIDREMLVEDRHGDIGISRDRLEVAHASCPAHSDEHREHLQAAGLADVTTGTALWRDREEFFPHLRFLPQVEKQLCDLQPFALLSVRSRLKEIEATVAQWQAEGSATPRWRTKKADGEHDRRRGQCVFTDLDGIERVFDEHVYYTPGAGRIHFRTDTAARSVTIARIGLKFP
ncbi:hypothetical protein [Actinomadura hibisca]|uniref:hypothetical protein n=1 Tax=Actinomadura hibisca TaxID=68565 RepID=UPI000830DA9B|nr:hypothetical protein [Actinomadura hibisca]